jgi:hypothetical protein
MAAHLYSCVGMVKLELSPCLPITVGSRFKTTVFAHTNIGIVDLNPTRGVDVCVFMLCLCGFMCK